jgi:hypothetical protein
LPKTAELLEWDNVKNINVLRNFGRDTLHVQHVQPNAHGKKRSKIPLPGLKKEIDRFKGVLAWYWHRHQTARSIQAQAETLAQHDA